MLLTDREIEQLFESTQAGTPFMHPWSENAKRPGRISYGVSSCGYDVRIDDEVLLHKPDGMSVVDPKDPDLFKQFSLMSIEDGASDYSVVIPPHGFALAKTMEYVWMPENLFALCVGKSTYARCGLVVNTTPIEPGWHGHITLELSNTTNAPLRVYIFEGIAQLVFYRLPEAPKRSYATKDGKYQGQTDVTLPRVD